MPKDLQCLARFQEETEFKFLYYTSTDSTNSEAKRLANLSYPEWTVVLANEQTSGRGRHGRNWHSPEGRNIYMTIILRPPSEEFHYNLINLSAALSVLEGIREVMEIERVSPPPIASCKWPNDIYLGDKKVSGILSEATFKGNAIDYIVVGIGINANITQEELPHELRGIATSLAIETGRHYSRGQLIKSILRNFEKNYRMLYTDKDYILNTWGQNSSTLFKKVKAYTNEGLIEGLAEGIDERGFLIIHTPEGKKNINSADILHLR
ncbi:MAG: biotin--[acetyl-CoA-carboxylase] ligase [Nitrospirae bacterium]|nr:biotin--[acetyl-CoA-carboxylase] ligase [Nitrospirota bacterium]